MSFHSSQTSGQVSRKNGPSKFFSRISPRLGASAVIGIFSLGLLCGCTKKKDEAKVVNLAIWGNYLSPETQARFEKQTGIQVNVSNYSSNEELLAKIQSGASGIDVAVPSDYMVEIMAKTGKLEPLNLAAVTHKNLIDPQWLHPNYDPENKYSLPYAWSTTGLAINTELYKKNLKSWKEFFTDKDLQGRISLLDDVREVTAAALKLHGFSVNSTDPKQLAEAKASLMELKPRVKMFRSDTVEALVNKEVAVAQAYSTDALQAAMKTDGRIKFVIPQEGGTRAVDNLVIVKGATHVKEALLLIDFLLSPEANLQFVEKVRGGPVLTTTREKLPTDLKNNTALFPSKEQMSRLERIRDLGPATRLYDELWTEFKSE
jgi:spermidine/putrescine transport system substrate-binding protein